MQLETSNQGEEAGNEARMLSGTALTFTSRTDATALSFRDMNSTSCGKGNMTNEGYIQGGGQTNSPEHRHSLE